MLRRLTMAAGIVLALAAGPVLAKDLAFKADLRGDTPSTTTGSRATGHATIRVNTDNQTVDVLLNVDGLKVADLWSHLLNSPMGAIHLHVYGSRDHSAGAGAALMFPLPYGPAYADTATGFKVDMKAEPYAEGAKLVNSKATFDEFVSSLQNGRIVLNIHTNKDNNGEISGDIVPAA